MPSCLQLERLSTAAQNAIVCEKATGAPAELTVAQWLIESGWGAHEPGNNCFGIKAYAGCYGIQWLETLELVGGVLKPLRQEFAAFPTLTACFQKHAEIICQGAPYQRVWREYEQSKSLTELIKGVAPIYATSPNYSGILLEVVCMPEVVSAIAQARLQSS